MAKNPKKSEDVEEKEVSAATEETKETEESTAIEKAKPNALSTIGEGDEAFLSLYGSAVERVSVELPTPAAFQEIIDGLPEEFYIAPEPARDLGTQEDPELEAFFASTGAEIVTSTEPRAYYRLSTDQVHMPPIATFFDAARYYGVLGHELTHWTGSTKRLDRINKYNNRTAYAFEELVAEIGACILGVKLGIEPDFDQSAAYVENWLEALKNDKGLIFKAASEAQKAVDFIMEAATSNDAKAREAA